MLIPRLIGGKSYIRAPIRTHFHRPISLGTRPNPEIPYLTGQPTHETRPHYIPTAGQLTPGISAAEYYHRRLELALKLPEKSAAVLVGNRVQHSSGAVFYNFQQNNDLYYLSGWLEPDLVIVIEKIAANNDENDVVFHMIVPPKNPASELWEGAKLGLEGAYDYFNADEVAPIGRVDSYLRSIIERNEVIYYDTQSMGPGGSKFGSFFDFTAKGHLATINEMLRLTRALVRPLKSVVAELRSLKSESEVKVMHKAGQISSRAINTAMAKVGLGNPFKTEKTLARYLEYAFVRGGCDREAYIPVVASGKNALTIHYTRNDDLLYEDETVFVDAGGKLGGYCADISRTWPNSARGFSEAQKDIYQVVLNANKVCIGQCSENAGMSLHNLHELAVMTLTQELRQIAGFEHVSRAEVARDLFPHYIGHHLGLDLHDIPSVSRNARLKKGNVVTIEPGLYIPQDSRWPKHFHGIGMRVEDDIAVGKTPSDILNLTSLCVKEVEDIETLIRLGKVTTPGVYDEAVETDL